MGWMEGMLSGFSSRKAEIEQQNLNEAHLANQREAKIYEALINSPDPEIKSMAVTGLLDSAKPGKRKSGLKGWLGEMQENPALGRIHDLINTPVTEKQTTVTPGLDSTQTSGYLATPPGAQSSMSMPETNAVTPGSAPIAKPSPIPTDRNLTSTEVPGPAVGRTDTTTVTRPREVFRSPEDQTLLTKKAAAQGDVEGEVAGLVATGVPQAEARKIIADRMRRASATGSAPFRSVKGTRADGTPAFGVFNQSTGLYHDPVNGQPMTDFRPAEAGGASERFGVNREALARSNFGKPFKDLTQDQQTQVMAKEQEYLKNSAESRIEGTGAGKMQNPADLNTAQRTGVPVGTKPADVVGQSVGTMQQQDTIRTVGEVKQQLEHIRDQMLDVLPSDNDMIGGLLPGAVMAVRRRDPAYRAKIAALESAVNNVVNVHARAVGQQRGAQTENDALRAEAGITSIRDSLLNGDTRESTIARINESLQYIEKVLAATPGSPSARPGVAAPPPTVLGPKGTQATGAAATAVGASPPSPAGAPGPEWQMINGQLHHNGQPY